MSSNHRHIGLGLIDNMLIGYNVSMIWCGENETFKALLSRVLHGMFGAISSHSDDVEYILQMSYFEGYGGKISDLLRRRNASNLKVEQIVIEHMKKIRVQSEDEVNHLIESGKANKDSYHEMEMVQFELTQINKTNDVMLRSRVRLFRLSEYDALQSVVDDALNIANKATSNDQMADLMKNALTGHCE